MTSVSVGDFLWGEPCFPLPPPQSPAFSLCHRHKIHKLSKPANFFETWFTCSSVCVPCILVLGILKSQELVNKWRFMFHIKIVSPFHPILKRHCSLSLEQNSERFNQQTKKRRRDSMDDNLSNIFPNLVWLEQLDTLSECKDQSSLIFNAISWTVTYAKVSPRHSSSRCSTDSDIYAGMGGSLWNYTHGVN